MNIEQKIYISFLSSSCLRACFSLHFIKTHTFIKYDAKYQSLITELEKRMHENEKKKSRTKKTKNVPFTVYSSVIMTILSFSSFQRLLVLRSFNGKTMKNRALLKLNHQQIHTQTRTVFTSSGSEYSVYTMHRRNIWWNSNGKYTCSFDSKISGKWAYIEHPTCQTIIINHFKLNKSFSFRHLF